jgi:hypothetical protein
MQQFEAEDIARLERAYSTPKLSTKDGVFAQPSGLVRAKSVWMWVVALAISPVNLLEK